MTKHNRTFAFAVLLLALGGLLSAARNFAQDAPPDDDRSVGVVLRPQAKPKPAPRLTARPTPYHQPTPTPAPKPKPVYRANKKSSFGVAPPRRKINANVGVTVFLAEKAKELPNSQNSQAGPFVRTEDNTPLTPGDKIRIAIESSVRGYLYVIDRELYDDGTKGRALLIFPTLLTYGGDNRIEPGLPRMIPDPSGSLTVTPNNQGKTQVAESLTIIISPVRLQLPRPLGETEMVLPDELMAQWEQQWSVPTARASLVGGIGQVETPREKQAANTTPKELPNSANKPQVLTEEDPSPQNVYQITMASGKQALFTVNLRFKAAS